MAKAATENMERRFRGLTRPQIRTLIELDERAMNATGSVDMMGIAMDCGSTITEFTADHALHYARMAEAQGMLGVADAWYSWCVGWQPGDRDDQRRREEQVKAFLIRNGRLNDLNERRFTCTLDEWCHAANVALKDCRVFYMFDGFGAKKDARVVLNTFVRINDRRGIQRFLARALQYVNKDDAVVELAARALGRSLTTRERERIAWRLLRCSADLSVVLAYIRKHRLHRLHRPLITAAVSSVWYEYATIREWAELLHVPLRTRDIERCYEKFRCSMNECEAPAAVAAAEALAQRSKRWRTKMPEIYRWARSNQLKRDEAERAEEYGKRCGRPLTTEELLSVARNIARQAADGADWAVARRKFCLDLAAERIAAAVGAPPEHHEERATPAA